MKILESKKVSNPPPPPKKCYDVLPEVSSETPMPKVEPPKQSDYFTCKMLIELLKSVPTDAAVYIESDHGQVPEPVSGIAVNFNTSHPYEGEDLNWEDPSDVSCIDRATNVKIW